MRLAGCRTGRTRRQEQECRNPGRAEIHDRYRERQDRRPSQVCANSRWGKRHPEQCLLLRSIFNRSGSKAASPIRDGMPSGLDLSSGQEATGHCAFDFFLTWRQTMTNLSRLALIAAIAVVGIASPAFAQSFDPEAGSGNVLGFSSAPVTASGNQRITVASHRVRHRAVAKQQSGVNSFAMVPGTPSGYDPSIATQR